MAESARIRSIDIFRGLTMLVMIFVNDLASVRDLPWWNYHMVPNKSGMTYVDVVFPAFLFILGMAIPLAVKRRLEQGDSMLKLWSHILLRSIGLVVLGEILANVGNVDPALTGLPGRWWATLALLGAILFYLDTPKRWLKYAGLALLIAMLAIFRRTTPGGPAWLDFSYPEILGLIGRVYLAACVLYIPLRNKLWAPMVWFAALTAWNVATRVGLPSINRILPYWVWPFDNGELPSIAMAGIVTYLIVVDNRIAATWRQKLLWASGFAAILFAGAWTFTSLGISKNAATPAWCLYSCGISLVLFVAIYWLADVRHNYRWAAFVKPAGSNTLLTYLLPDLYYFVLGGLMFPRLFRQGWPGAVRAAIFTGCILAVSYVLTRMKIRMQL